MPDLCRMFVDDFLQNSWESVKALVQALKTFEAKNRKPVELFTFKDTQRVSHVFGGTRFFIRASVEYANPQVTLEEIQGIIGARMLQVCGNYFYQHGLRELEEADYLAVCELLKKPPLEPAVAFLLNTDDVEPDRYSMNPLRASLVASGQSAFPAAKVRTDQLKLDAAFVKKYGDKLVSKLEVEIINRHLPDSNGSYLDFVDASKFAQLRHLSKVFGMDLCLPAFRMPLTMLEQEKKDGLLHRIISEVHRDYDSISQAYDCMNRSMNKRTTLLTVPHSQKGYGSKRCARGKLRFNESNLDCVSVTYRDTRLYPNAIDPKDVAVARCEDQFEVSAERLADYSYAETPSSPQFFLYSLGSPEDAALWHGVGVFGSPKLLHSCANVRRAYRRGSLMAGLRERFGVRVEVPLQFNLVPEGMWVHPVYRNIDASVGSVKKPLDLTCMGMKIEHLATFK